ncbi:MAG: hypothetical protein ACYCSS_14790 [Sulfuriferula sp.]
MKRIVLLLVLFSISFPSWADDDPYEPPSWIGVWKGKVGKQPVTACLENDCGGSICGAYYYDKHLNIIRLKPAEEHPQGKKLPTFLEDISNPSKTPKSMWKLSQPNEDTLVWTWSTKDKKYPINLRRADDIDKAQVRFPMDDDYDRACGSDAFNNARELRPHVASSIGTIHDTPYRILSVDFEKIFAAEVTSFKLLGTDQNSMRINGQIRNELREELKLALGCIRSSLNLWGEEGEVLSTKKPLWISHHWVIAETDFNGFCSGPYPPKNVGHETWNLQTGKRENLWLWFNSSGARVIHNNLATPDAYDEVMIGPKLRQELIRGWLRNKPDKDCADIGRTEDGWEVWPNERGLAFTPSLPNAAFACADDVVVPFEKILPMLNAKGQAAVAALRADFARLGLHKI